MSSYFDNVSFVMTLKNAAMTPQAPFPELTAALAFSPHWDAKAYVEEKTSDEKTAIQPITIITAQYKLRTCFVRLSIENKIGMMHITRIKMDKLTTIETRKFLGLKKISKNEIIADGILYERLMSAPMLMFKSENKGEKISMALIAIL